MRYARAEYWIAKEERTIEEERQEQERLAYRWTQEDEDDRRFEEYRDERNFGI